MTRTSIVVTLVEWAHGGLGDVNVLKASEDAQPCRTVTVSKHRPQAVPAVTLPELEHDPKVRLIPGRLLRTSGIKRFVTHRNRSASVDGQAHIGLTATLRENPMRLSVHLENFAETRNCGLYPSTRIWYDDLSEKWRVMLGWFGDLRTWTNVLPTNETGSTSSGAGSRRVDLVLAVCLRPPKRVEVGAVGEEDAHEEAEEPVTLSSSMDAVEQVEPTQSKPV